MNNLDNLKAFFIVFSVKRFIDVLDQENQPGSGPDPDPDHRLLGLQRSSDTRSIKTKKISLPSTYRAPDPNLAKYRIFNTSF